MPRDNRPDLTDADPELPVLTAAQASALRALAAPFTQAGHYSLHDLALWCRDVPQDRWPDIVTAHFANLRQASQGNESAAELLRGAHIRLLPVESLTSDLAGVMRYTDEIADGLVCAYALDGPTSVRILTDADVERAGPEELWQAASENLMRVPVETADIPVEGAARLHSLYGDSPFIASKALFLSDAVRQAGGEPLPEAGALVVVPSRNHLVYHPIADGSVVDALNSLATYALGAYEDGPGALSPRVYWWHRGRRRLTSLTVIDHDTRTFSLQPPPHLLGLMKGLVRLDRAGRLDTAAAAPAVDHLARTAAQSISHLVQDQAALGDAFAAALALAHAHCAHDPRAAEIDTWDAWATAVQLGSALFVGAQPQQCRLGEEDVWQLPAMAAEPPADARAWLDAFYLAVVCRQKDRISGLCQVPLETLRRDDSVDEHVLHWIDTLQTFFRHGLTNDVVGKLIATMETSMPEALTHAPSDFVDRIDYQPAALFHQIVKNDHTAFDQALTEALAHHRNYWGASSAPRARVALGPLAMASLAYDYGFPITTDQPHLPMYLLNRERIEDIP